MSFDAKAILDRMFSPLRLLGEALDHYNTARDDLYDQITEVDKATDRVIDLLKDYAKTLNREDDDDYEIFDDIEDALQDYAAEHVVLQQELTEANDRWRTVTDTFATQEDS